MSLEKFRTFDEARRARWWSASHPRLARRIGSWWRNIAAMTPPREARTGVWKYRSIADANAEREARERTYPKWPRTPDGRSGVS